MGPVLTSLFPELNGQSPGHGSVGSWAEGVSIFPAERPPVPHRAGMRRSSAVWALLYVLLSLRTFGGLAPPLMVPPCLVFLSSRRPAWSALPWGWEGRQGGTGRILWSLRPLTSQFSSCVVCRSLPMPRCLGRLHSGGGGVAHAVRPGNLRSGNPKTPSPCRPSGPKMVWVGRGLEVTGSQDGRGYVAIFTPLRSGDLDSRGIRHYCWVDELRSEAPAICPPPEPPPRPRLPSPPRLPASDSTFRFPHQSASSFIPTPFWKLCSFEWLQSSSSWEAAVSNRV